jgi:hypothetical protein
MLYKNSSWYAFGVRAGVVGGLFALLLCVSPAVGQIGVGIKMDHRVVMEGEPTVVTIGVQNGSETPLVFNKVYHNAELQVSLRRGRATGDPVYKRLERDFVILPDDRGDNLVELTSLKDMRRPGSYQIWAQVLYDGRVFTARAYAFDVVHGIELISVQRHLRGYESIRLTYSLRYCARGGAEYAFLVVKDTMRDVLYGTFRLGTLVRVGDPAMSFDAKGRLVVVHQSGRNRFTRSVIATHRNGASFEAQTHHLPDGTPTSTRNMGASTKAKSETR